jgi:hypothetical protein
MQFTSTNQHIDLITLFVYTLSRHAVFTLIIFGNFPEIFCHSYIGFQKINVYFSRMF